MRSSLMASTTSFAHLLGLGAPKAGKQAAEEDDPDKDEHREDAKGTKSKAADDEKPDDQGEDESDEDYKERKKREQDDAKGKKARSKGKAEGEDEDEDEDDTAKKAARREERARCAAIFAAPAAGVRPDLAAHFAFSTDLDARAAVAALTVAAEGHAAPRRAGLADRMARESNPDLGSGDAAPGALKPHQRLAAAHAKATGKKP